MRRDLDSTSICRSSDRPYVKFFMINAILLILILCLLAGAIMNLFSSKVEPELRFCEIHDWVLDQNEKMICMECGYRPEENQ